VQMVDQSKLIQPIQMFFKSIWHTERTFIQGKNAISSHPCQRYAVHLIHSVCVVQNTVDMFGRNNIPLSFNMP